MPAAAAPSPLQQALAARAQNDSIRQIILKGGPVGNVWQPPAINMWQAINPGLPAAVAPGTVLTAYLRPVGLIKKCWVQFKATVSAGVTSQQNLTKLGLANLISNVTVYDLANNTRINTTGWHLVAVATAKRRRVFGAAYTNDTPFGYGDNFNRSIYAPSSIAANGSSEIDLILEVPFAYSDRDLRGALYADTTQASVLLQVTLNPNMFVASTADATNALYQSAGADLATLSAVQWQVYQNYLDQLPRMSNGVPLLPPQDIATAYVLTNTVSALPVANQDNTTPFINARKFMSLVVGYDNAGTLNIGTDLNSIAIVSANYTNIMKVDPKTLSVMDRDHNGVDMPSGFYYLDFRDRPIDTDQYGNMQVVLNPSAVGGATALFMFGWEAMGMIGQINQGGSIPSGS